jgi:hypothetical protein
MTKSEDLNKYAREIYSDIVSSFSPAQSPIDLKTKVDSLDISKSLYLSGLEYSRLLLTLKKYLSKYIETRKNKGSHAKFEFLISDNDYITGLANIKPEFSVFPDFYRYMSSMKDDTFEKFSAKFINLHFSDFAFATRQSGDGGIDFIGTGNFKKLQNFNGKSIDLKNKNIKFRIVGQSKRYNPKNPIGPKEIREFLGSVRILQEAANPNKVSAWLGQKDVLNKIKLADPFIYIFLSTSYYSDDAIKLSTKLGIYIYDVDDLIFDLIESGIGIFNDKFNAVLFENWCEG